jgi:cytochrome c oxidase subunit I
VPAFLDANRNPGPGAPRFTPDNPVPIEPSSNVKKIPDANTVVVADNK